MQGKVKFFDSMKGFGLIKCEVEGDVFVHCNEVEGKRALHDGEHVSFELAHGHKGAYATRVQVIADSRGNLPPLMPTLLEVQ